MTTRSDGARDDGPLGPMRAGRSLGRTLYIMVPGDDRKADRCIGIVDTPAQAAAIVEAVNASAAAAAQVERHRSVAEDFAAERDHLAAKLDAVRRWADDQWPYKEHLLRAELLEILDRPPAREDAEP